MKQKQFFKILILAVVILVVAPPAFAGGESQTKFVKPGDGMVVVADPGKGRLAVFSEAEFRDSKFDILENFRRGWEEIPRSRTLSLQEGRKMAGFSAAAGLIAIQQKKGEKKFTLIFSYTYTTNKGFVVVRQILWTVGHSEFKGGKIEFEDNNASNSITAIPGGYVWETRLPATGGKVIIHTRRRSAELKVE